jgi:hypothetical protein
MVADYAVWAVDSKDNAAIVRKRDSGGATVVIDGGILVYGWNDDFIVAKRHTGSWFIVEVATERVHGPLTREQYAEVRKTLGLPPDLTFTKNVWGKSGVK